MLSFYVWGFCDPVFVDVGGEMRREMGETVKVATRPSRLYCLSMGKSAKETKSQKRNHKKKELKRERKSKTHRVFPLNSGYSSCYHHMTYPS